MAIVLERKTIPAGEGAYHIHWTREQVYRMYDIGVIDPQEHFELIGGEIFQKMGMNPPHAFALSKAFRRLLELLTNDYTVRNQLPLVLATDGEPEPDLCVVRGTDATYAKTHPTQDDALLVVEVSDSTLAFDRGRKGSYYAEAGIADYWIVNIADACVEIYRNPHPDASNAYGFAYDAPIIANAGDTVSPLSLPGTVIAVADLLPAP